MKRFFIMCAVLSIALPSVVGTYKVSAAVPVIAPKATITITEKLAAKNIIISESVAKDLTKSQLQSLMEVHAADLSGLQLDGNTLNTANDGLKGKDFLDIPVTWTTTNETVNVHLVVVADEAVISPDAQKAVNAYAVTMGKEEANAIGLNSDQASLDIYTRAKTYKSDGTTSKAALDDATSYFNALKNAESNDVINITYNFSESDKTVSKNVAVTVFSGSLNFTSAPATMDFGQLKVKPSSIIDFPNYNQDVIVTDTRQSSTNTGWTMFVKENTPLVEIDNSGTVVSGGHSLAGALWFSNDGVTKTMLSTNNAIVQSQASGTNGGIFNISQNWNETSKKGIHLEVPVTQQYVAKYHGEVTWTLSDVPGN
ncbi:WxL domain-containing protein [Lactococcus garvieae]|uniref:WxL domain-containing protein n=1 Tax=Lactococcus garvieae TaxID=1363 RepID=UPI0018D7FA11|nr:WxL domain-containing protein [Lactococcus garvieae]QPS72037.1 WxL domain-containing protein [Lactococcus garvieae]